MGEKSRLKIDRPSHEKKKLMNFVCVHSQHILFHFISFSQKEESLEVNFHLRGGGDVGVGVWGDSDGCIDEEGTVLLYSGRQT